MINKKLKEIGYTHKIQCFSENGILQAESIVKGYIESDKKISLYWSRETTKIVRSIKF